MNQSLSYWSDTVTLPILSSIRKDLSCEVTIVGAGISGLTAAYLLLKKGKTVVILDDGPIAGGETSRTTAHLAYFLDDRFSKLAKLFGDDGLKLAIDGHKEAIDLIERICADENIACDFERIDGYLFDEWKKGDILKEEIKALEKACIKDGKIKPSSFSFFKSKDLLQLPDQAQFHPLKYIAGITDAILKMGGQILKGHVTEIKGGTLCETITDKNHKVTSSSIIVATNSPINNRFVIHTKQAAYRTYVIASLIPKGSIPKGLYYDTYDPYHYVRIHSHNDKKDLLIIGGEDHKTGQENHPKDSYAKLESWTRDRFPMMEEISYRWSGQVMEPVDGIAFLGANPLEENIFIITGDSGNGLTHGTLGALICSSQILRIPIPFTKLFDPARKTLASLDKFAKENLNVACQYLDWFKTGDEPRPGTGRICQKDGKKVAVYMDEKGTSHTFSAVCPHLGCIVQWNEAENTWDCPCHGSRFDSLGQNLNGPAVTPLNPE